MPDVDNPLAVSPATVEAFSRFIDSSPSSRHAAEQGAALLERAGFTAIAADGEGPWDASPGGHYLLRGGSLMAFVVPDNAGLDSAFRIIGCHTDSPGLKLKDIGTLNQHGFSQAAVEVYGGAILSSWFDRELRLAGVVATADGALHTIDTGPVMRVANLCIHLDREKNNSFSPDRQTHMQPIIAADADTDIMEIIAGIVGCRAGEIVGHDLISALAEKPAVFGAHHNLLAASRLDNLSSMWPALQALLHAAATTGDTEIDFTGIPTPDNGDIAVLAAFDHEEVGSATRLGAQGPILSEVITRTAAALGADREHTARMIARSTCVSSDAAHSVHPNYAGHHDAINRPMMGRGPAIKANANQRYATEAETAALFRRACRSAGVPSQVFVSHNGMPCGSTIGPLTATRLGIKTVDIGMPILSMHSAREMCATADIGYLGRALAGYLSLGR
ncbi:M18 family aminopeptidase [Corynebacterium mendelii]|uniref:M18 family aminopeptidase n=1 Tax=Corynebacterium mendelii TaxID=2765362 RepID=A0A939E0A3_9CORY|nr:M18 family aminopeptidase [Corynebacterium mendelii]MBN9643503.1 M18 family aminopeptidase [Corynebacterium mendelii]